jgi:ParB-like chromosome segregation protein Spo0J
MKNKIVLIDINKLRHHEEIDQQHLLEIIFQVKEDGFLKNPVVVDQKNFIILDGHHRVAALKQIGANKVPSFLVDYQNNDIRVFLRRKLKLTEPIKQVVIKNSLSNILFPSKTTRHLIKNRPRNINIKISKLY